MADGGEPGRSQESSTRVKAVAWSHRHYWLVNLGERRLQVVQITQIFGGLVLLLIGLVM